MDRSIEAIAATCGLIHDLGNPPFGHAGEDAIRAWFHEPEQATLMATLNDQQKRDFEIFEGNAQSLRLVARLQILADDKGLNLTFGTLSALMKYVASSHQADKHAINRALRKPGYFASENHIVEKIRCRTRTGSARHPISFLVEAADDIAYLPGDVEDAVKKGDLRWKELKELLDTAKSDSATKALDIQERILKAGRETLAGDLDGDIWASAFRTAAINVMVDGAFRVFEKRYEDIMQGNYLGSLLKDSDAADLADCLRNIAREHVYSTRSTLELELMGRRVIGDLMGVFWEGAQDMPPTGDPDTSTFAGKAAALISRNYRRVFQDSLDDGELPEEYYRLQLVTDYVCGMTDSFAKGMHAGLYNGT